MCISLDVICDYVIWCWEGLGARGEGDDRRWDDWMASLSRWTWVWMNSGSWWCTGRSGVLRFMGSQRVGHDWATDLICSDLNMIWRLVLFFSTLYKDILHKISNDVTLPLHISNMSNHYWTSFFECYIK